MYVLALDPGLEDITAIYEKHYWDHIMEMESAYGVDLIAELYYCQFLFW